MMYKTTKKCLFALGLWATVALAQSADRFSYSSDGSEVSDKTTGLTWRRCAEGMSWSGSTCTGTTVTYAHEGALQRAQSQIGWRLPNVKELSSIVDDSRVRPAIDPVAFPNTSSAWFWTSSYYSNNSTYPWAVNFDPGRVEAYVYSGRRNANLLIRLVR